MKIFVMVCLVLLLAGPVGAETFPYGDGCNTCQGDRNGGIVLCTLLACVPPNKGTIVLPPDPCLAQMEAAMRAMEPYVEWFTGLSGPDINFDDKQQIRLLAKIYQQWKAVKRDCWRTP